MHNRDVLSAVIGGLAISPERCVALFAHGGHVLTEEEVAALTSGDAECTDALTEAFLDAFIVEQRGPRDPSKPAPPPAPLTNNAIFKKLRIALTLREEDVLRLLDAGGHPMTGRELTTLFRKAGHKHFRACPDHVLRAFLSGLGQ